MRKYILYSHDGSANHGCEALVRTTAALLNLPKHKLVLISKSPTEDAQYGIDQICTLVQQGAKKPISKFDRNFFHAYWALRAHNNYYPMDCLSEIQGSHVRRGDIALSIGGDTYCYGGTKELAQTHTMWKYAGLKTVYWGCSIEPELLNDPDVVADIQRYDLITARETISYNALLKVNSNTIQVADSAFLLPAKKVSLPEAFENSDLIGINFSSMIESHETSPEMARKNFENLIEKVLRETAMKILLIPHVVWSKQDDRNVLQRLYDKYAYSDRIYMVCDCTCEELKGYIAKCKLFIGARTHATIAAYSSYVPTLVVGYSVKARGIAQDLFGTDENYVLPVQNLTHENDLADSFDWLMDHRLEIADHLHKIIPQYVLRAHYGLKALKKL